jgi:hypothetical protein
MRVASARRPSPHFEALDSQIRTTILEAINRVIRRAAQGENDPSNSGTALAQVRALEQLIRWSEHEIGRLAVQAVAEGRSLADIGDALGMSKQAVAHKLRHFDEELRQARIARG